MSKKTSSVLLKKISTRTFIIFSVSILVFGLIFISVLYYLLNIQYKPPGTYSTLGGPVTSPPKSLRMDLETPGENTLSFDPTIVISGQTGPGMDVLVISDSQDLMLKSKPDGSFSTIINLTEGVNKIEAVVFDATGDSRFAQRTVYYSREKI